MLMFLCGCKIFCCYLLGDINSLLSLPASPSPAPEAAPWPVGHLHQQPHGRQDLSGCGHCRLQGLTLHLGGCPREDLHWCPGRQSPVKFFTNGLMLGDRKCSVVWDALLWDREFTMDLCAQSTRGVRPSMSLSPGC